MDDLKEQMQDNFLQYASYVILDRAIPNVVDGLKPVQRRILHTLFKMDDGKLHKVANVAGQTMRYHPHGDSPITEALVNLANKDFLLDKQGNFGNLYTGDPAAASRYIETRLSELAKETLFNEELTEMVPSYDGRNDEPTTLPAKIPVLLMQGAEGIAVGMATKILPHNFQELLQAEIAYLEGKPFKLLPDFPTGGIMDASDYAKGLGKIKLRVKLSTPDDKTILIKEICYGTTTESLISSIDEAAKKGKIKIDSISDYTSDKVEIEIKLPRGQHANQILDALYGFTECEVSLSSQVIVIKDNLPWQTDIHEILKYNADALTAYLKKELELSREKLLEKIFHKSLERIFIENRLYKKIEEVTSYEKIHSVITASLEPYHQDLLRIPTQADRERLLNIPIRRISLFDMKKNEEEIALAEKAREEVEKELKQIKRFTIKYLKALLAKYGKLFPRKTQVKNIEAIDMKAISTKKVKVHFDLTGGFMGTKIQGDLSLECTNFDKLLLFFQDGSYMVSSLEEKKYIYLSGSPLIFAGIADKKTPFVLLYKAKSGRLFAKRFIIEKFLSEKLYRYFEEGGTLEFLTNAPDVKIAIEFKQKGSLSLQGGAIPLKPVGTKGMQVTDKAVKKVSANVPLNLECIGKS